MEGYVKNSPAHPSNVLQCRTALSFNCCEGQVRAFLERINTADTADVLSKNRVILTHVHSFTRRQHEQK